MTTYAYTPPFPREYRDPRIASPRLSCILGCNFLFKTAFLISMGFYTFYEGFTVQLVVDTPYLVDENETIIVLEPTTTALQIPWLIIGICISSYMLICCNCLIARSSVDGYYINTPISEKQATVQERFRLCTGLNFYSIYTGKNVLGYFAITFLNLMSQFLLIFAFCVIMGLRNLSTVLAMTALTCTLFMINRIYAPKRNSALLLRWILGIGVMSIIWFVVIYQSLDAPQSSTKYPVAIFFLLVYTLIVLVVPLLRWDEYHELVQFEDMMETRIFHMAKLASMYELNGESFEKIAENYESQAIGRKEIPVDFSFMSVTKLNSDLEKINYYKFSRSFTNCLNKTGFYDLLNILCCRRKDKLIDTGIVYRSRKFINESVQQNLDRSRLQQKSNTKERSEGNPSDWNNLNNMPDVFKDIWVYRIKYVSTIMQLFVIDVWLDFFSSLFLVVPLIIAMQAVPVEATNII